MMKAIGSFDSEMRLYAYIHIELQLMCCVCPTYCVDFDPRSVVVLYSTKYELEFALII